MSWKSPTKAKSAPVLGGTHADLTDLSSTYKDILSEPATTVSWVPTAVPAGLSLLRSLALFAVSAAGCVVAALGLGLLCYLLLTRALTPAQHIHTRTLFLDYSHADLLAQAAFLPGGEPASGIIPPNLPPSTRFLPPGQRVDVWLELRLPDGSPSNCRGGMAQVVAELTTLDGKTAARTSRPLLLRSRGWDLWSVLTTPLHWVGLGSSSHTERVLLFPDYKEQEKLPFLVFQVAIKTRDPAWAPEVLGAQVKVQLRLGLLRGLLYALRPGGLLMLLLGAAALAALLGGSGVAALFITLWVYTGWGGEGQGTGPPSGAEDLSSLAPSEGEMDETSSVSGFSEAESVEMRPSPGVVAEELEGEEEWQEVGPETSAAAAAAGSWQERGSAAAEGRGPGPASSVDDTAFASGAASAAADWEVRGRQDLRQRPGAQRKRY